LSVGHDSTGRIASLTATWYYPVDGGSPAKRL